MPTESIPPGYCQCGCGNLTRLRTRHSIRDGYRIGEPSFYLLGHARRRAPVDYVVLDCGYETPCWVWQLATNEHGYGILNRDGYKGRAHVWMYRRLVGPIPQGLQLDHLCRVRPCCNPAHLEPVTNAVNAQRGAKAKITAEQAAVIRTSTGTNREVGARFGLSHEQARQIRLGRQWRTDL